MQSFFLASIPQIYFQKHHELAPRSEFACNSGECLACVAVARCHGARLKAKAVEDQLPMAKPAYMGTQKALSLH